MELLKLIGAFKGKTLRPADLGVLKVSLMVAALDGEITEDEYKTFGLLARKCPDYTKEAGEKALKEALHSAGYLLLVAKRSSDAVLMKEFVAEAKAAMPGGFDRLSVGEIRQAMILWIAMGMSDGDYSSRERKCIEALRKLVAELKVSQKIEDEARWRNLAQDEFSAAGVFDFGSGTVPVVSRDFVKDVESLMSALGDSAEAARALKSLASAADLA